MPGKTIAILGKFLKTARPKMQTISYAEIKLCPRQGTLKRYILYLWFFRVKCDSQ